MKATKSEITVAKQAAKDQGITLTDEQAEVHANRILQNLEGSRSEFYYAAKSYFLN